MSRRTQTQLLLHPVMRRHMEDQMLFAFIQGAKAVNDKLTTPKAVRLFAEHFGLEVDVQVMTVKYNRMRSEALRQNIFANDTNTKRKN
jgi:hypothetical protein